MRTANDPLVGLSSLLLLVIALGGVGLSVRLNSALSQSEGNRLQAENDRDAARRADAEGKEKLYQSLVSEAKAGHFSQRVGQRFGTLDAIRRASALARELEKPPAAFDELRNLAVAALALPDLRPAGAWIGDPDEKGWVSSYRGTDPQFRFVAIANPGGDVSLRHVGTGPADTGEIARLPGFGSEARPLWSPDGRFLAVWHWPIGRLQVWRADGPTPTLAMEEKSDCRAFGFRPTGGQVIAAGGGSLRVYDLADGRVTRSFPFTEEVHGAIAHHPRLPRAALAGRRNTLIVDLATGKEAGRLLALAPPPFGRLAWHPDGELLAVATALHV